MYLLHSSNFKGGKKESRKFLKQAIESYCVLKDIRDFDAEDAINRIVEGPNGKPSIEGFADYSISHSGKYWAVLFDDEPCGLDIQLEKDMDYMALAERYYSEHELDEVRMYGTHAFFHIWSRREAFVKAIGGTVFSETPELIFHDYDCSMEIKYEGQIWQVRDVEMPMKIYAAVCSKRFEQIKPYALEFTSMLPR